MATTDIQDRPSLAPHVQTLLAALRMRIRLYVWAHGAAAAVAWLGVAFWGSLAVDWLFEPPAAVRGLMLAAVALVFAGVVVQLIVRRAVVPLSDSSMATLLERRFPQINDSLLTAVVLTERDRDPAECNPQMLAHTCRQAADKTAGVRLVSVFNPLPLRQGLAAAVLLGATVGLFAVQSPAAMGTWARRNLGFSDELWPRQVRLVVEGFEDGIHKVARGADFQVIAKADTAWPLVPETAQIYYRIEGGARGRATMNRLGVAGDKAPFQPYSYTFPGVLAPVTFDVVGGDCRVSDLRIEVVDSPTLSEMVLDCEYPPYMGRAPRSVAVSGVVQIARGAKVTVRTAANKELVRVQIDAAHGDRSAAAVVLQSGGLNPDRRGFRYTIPALDEDTTLLFTLSDSDGITGREPVRLTLMATADEAPKLAVQLDGVGQAITAKARLPVAGTITDDYGIDRAWFEYAVDQQPPATQAIGARPEQATEWKLAAGMEVGDLNLKPAQKLSLGVKAADRYDLGKGPNVGASEQWLLDVVTPEQLQAMLQSRELVLRQRFEAIIQEVTETRDLLLDLEFGPRAPAAQSEEAAGKEAKKEKAASAAEPGDEPGDEPDKEARGPDPAAQQRHVEQAAQNCRKNAHETQSMAEAFDDIRKQFVNNRIDNEELRSRLQQGIVGPLQQVVAEMFPELELRLEDLRGKLGDERSAPAARDAARQQADEILLAMRKVLGRMIELEDFNEAVELLRGIIKLQDELDDQTKQRQKQMIRGLLEE